MGKIKNIVLLTAIISLLSGLIGCTKQVTDEKPQLTVSIPPQKYLLEKIVGDKFEVNSLLSPGVNPENYEPSINHLVGLQKSKAYFRIGNIGFEAATLPKINENFPELKIYNSSEGIPLIRGTHNHRHHHHPHISDADPHVWTSVKNAKFIAANMYQAILEIDPKNRNYYTTRYEKLCDELTALDDSISNILAPHKGETFLVWHPSLSYFARDYGLHQMSIEEQGKEASALQLKDLIDEAKAASPKIFLYQKEYDSRQAETINQEIGTEMVLIYPLNYEWQQEMLNIANAFATERND